MKKIYSIGGGKGGSGKSFIAASLGALFAREGSRVVLVDLDLGASNLHTFLNLKNPPRGLDEFIDKKIAHLEDVALATSVQNLYLISSARCSLEVANLFYAQKKKLISAIENLPFDYVLLDLGPGTHFNTLDFFLTASEGVFVATPEPTAIENTFRFIKSIYLRKLKQSLKEADIWYLCRDEIVAMSRNGLTSPIDFINILVKKDIEQGKIFEDLLNGLKLRLVMNKVRGQIRENLGRQIVEVCNRHLYPGFDLLETINYDSRVYDAILSKQIFIGKYPYTKTAVALQKAARKLKQEQPIAIGLES
ncbi:MAG: P-loop NTPase [Deltaproteobacteria bacterium]|nr:MAG: P-loop NTPase [Deltaproteobacteria bacterium]